MQEEQPGENNDVPVEQHDENNATSVEQHKEEHVDTKPVRLGELLIKKGMISRDQLDIVLREQKTPRGKQKMLGSILVELGFVTESALTEVISESSGNKQIDLRTVVLDQELINKLPKEVAYRYKAIPVSMDNETLNVAMTDIYNIMAIDQIHKHFPRNIRVVPYFAQESQILEIIDNYYQYQMSLNGILQEIESGTSEQKQMMASEVSAYVNPTVRLVNAFLVDAIKQGASDIHFEPEESFLRVRYRIDGNLVQVRSFHKEYWPAVVVRIKIISGMNIAETRHPQDGRISYNLFGRPIDFRVASQPTIHGENIVMRILDRKQSLVDISNLGFSTQNAEWLLKLLKRPEGVIIVTGPTGSGKTTTLYSILNYINTIDKNIMTLEDPVEYQLPMIRQSSVREGSGINFADGIRSLMRQDPDIIFVGEIRDNATATMAIRAAMTGHQVFTTLHTNDALGAIPRLVDIGVDKSLLSGSLICVIAQRLGRKLCEHCKKEKTATERECMILGVAKENPPTIYEHTGCDKCNDKGYKGRMAISELLVIDKGLDELIATNASRKKMLEYAVDNGFKTMVDDGVYKVLKGITDLEELIDTIDMTSRL